MPDQAGDVSPHSKISFLVRILELVWKIWTSQKAVLNDKLLGSCRYLFAIPGTPVNLIRRPIVKSLMRPRPIIKLKISS